MPTGYTFSFFIESTLQLDELLLRLNTTGPWRWLIAQENDDTIYLETIISDARQRGMLMIVPGGTPRETGHVRYVIGGDFVSINAAEEAAEDAIALRRQLTELLFQVTGAPQIVELMVGLSPVPSPKGVRGRVWRPCTRKRRRRRWQN